MNRNPNYYQSTRDIFSFFELVGWIGVGIGALLALIGMSTGGGAGMFGSPSFGSRLIGMLPGILIAFNSLILVAFAKFGSAGIDTAENTAEILNIQRRMENGARGQVQGTGPVTVKASDPIQAKISDAKVGEIYRTYAGVPVYHAEGGKLSALGQTFGNFFSAMTFIDQEKAAGRVPEAGESDPVDQHTPGSAPG